MVWRVSSLVPLGRKLVQTRNLPFPPPPKILLCIISSWLTGLTSSAAAGYSSVSGPHLAEVLVSEARHHVVEDIVL